MRQREVSEDHVYGQVVSVLTTVTQREKRKS